MMMHNNVDNSHLIPLVSVLMPVYNGEEYLREAVDSILAQTLSDFEFIIINDGSTDITEDIILSYNDQRIHYYKNEKNLGIVGTLNRGLDLCKGKYIARMDADDVSMPQRFEKQVAYMNTHPDVVACGCLYTVYGKENRGAVDVAIEADDVRMDMALFCQYAHSTMMLRREILEKHALRYREDYRHAEDYKLWTELLQYGDMVNLPEVLHSIRQCEEGISIVHSAEQKLLANKVRKEYLNFLGVKTEHTINEIELNKFSLEEIRLVLTNYFPLIIRCKPYNWIRKNYVSCLKKYMKQLGRFERVKELRKYNSILSIKDRLSIIIK